MSVAIDQSTEMIPEESTFPMSLLVNALDAVRFAASTDTTRYNLNGIYLERDGEALLAIATDGHRLARVRVVAIGADAIVLSERGFILSLPDADRITAEWKRLAKLHKPHAHTVRVSLHCTGNGEPMQVEVSAWGKVEVAFECKVVEGEFPNYRQAIPKIGEPAAAFNARYLRDTADAFKRFGMRDGNLRVHVSDAVSPWVFTASNPEVGELEVVNMPMRL